MKIILVAIISLCNIALASESPLAQEASAGINPSAPSIKQSSSNNLPSASSNTSNSEYIDTKGINLPTVSTDTLTLPSLEDLTPAAPIKKPETSSVETTKPEQAPTKSVPVIELPQVPAAQKEVVLPIAPALKEEAKPIVELPKEPAPTQVEHQANVEQKQPDKNEAQVIPVNRQYQKKEVKIGKKTKHKAHHKGAKTSHKKAHHKATKKIYIDEEFFDAETEFLFSQGDDVVLGKLTEEAYAQSLDFYDYLEIYKMHYISPEEMKKYKSIQKFLDHYENFYSSNNIL